MKEQDVICARGDFADSRSTAASVSPIYQTTAFDLEDLQHLADLSAGQQSGFIYSRDSNPNHEAFAATVARLEGAEAGLVCASGMGAMAAMVLAHVGKGDHVVAARVLYGRTCQFLLRLQSQFGVDVSFVDGTHPQAFREQATEQTKLGIVETVSNPLLEVADVPAIAEALGDIPLLVDSTFTTPCLQKPLELGASCVFHSASKYLNGHGDAMLGVVVGQQRQIDEAAAVATLLGMNTNPFESWLGGERPAHLASENGACKRDRARTGESPEGASGR